MKQYLVIRERDTQKVVYENLFLSLASAQEEILDWDEEDFDFEVEAAQ